ncbi:hypothetical protein [Lacibacter sp.]|uniref:hypothetical protein n=1 Tax=Lacibacter sp. TaxID=1915409 RepID=UPI002B4B3DDD|nr:hypothetical protein [Lacibacter sp.]HLP37748.1 hypothetical protein [Lacibacter sp.]
MADYFSALLDTTFTDAAATHALFVEAIVDDESDYTGRYRVTIDGSIVTELTWLANDTWEETGKGATERAKLIGEMIAGNEE